mmetsp:Transcript_1462/g.2223  ORF Transcript_1462/g.2223 Transcript_1462/m.2223 type:complete len:633 (-) Transcript_1462:211-2109(-)
MKESENGGCQSTESYHDDGSNASSVKSLGKKHGSGLGRMRNSWLRPQIKESLTLREDGAVESILTSKKGMPQRGKNGTSFSAWRKKNRNKVDNKTSKRIIKEVHKVIFPDGVWIRRWDATILSIVVFYIFYLPFQIGVTGGVYLLEYEWFFGLIVFLNCLLFVDSFLWFRRPFQTPEGKWVIDLKMIKRNYFKTWFIPNMLSNVPATIVFYVMHYKIANQYLGEEQKKDENTFAIILVFNVLKLFRLARIAKLLGESQAVSDFYAKNNSQAVSLVRYSILIVVLVHWFACLWCWVAYLENGNFDFSQTNNWIHGWVDENIPLGENAPQPYGPYNAGDRYMLALFWASQTITSIGYGNIAPQTRVEWCVSSFLQIIAGISWAYVIGGLITVVKGFNERKEEYGRRCDGATSLIKAFRRENEVQDQSTEQVIIGCDEVTNRIRAYVQKQYKYSNHIGCVSSISDNFPILHSLPPDLQRQASLLILRGNLDNISYLSSYYLSPEEQGRVAMQCMQLEFPAGETIHTDRGPNNIGRGIYLMYSGSAYSIFKLKKNKDKHSLLTVGSMIGCGRVLIEDGHEDCVGTKIFFLTYSKVLFIPRQAILEGMNEVAWKGSGRWIYVRTVLGHRDLIQVSQM